MLIMAKKKSAKKKPASKRKSSPEEDPLPENYNRKYIIERLLDQVTQDGIAGISAAKELRSMLSEEMPSRDLDISVAFVEINFDGYEFTADESTRELI